MNTTGRKVGACDVQQAAQGARREDRRDEEAGRGRHGGGGAAQKQHTDTQIKQCAAAVDNMQWSGFGVYGQCYKKTDASCKSSMDASNQMSPEIAKSCNARVVEFCKRYQTQDGFLKAKGDENAAQMCGVTTASIKEAQCPKAAQSESLAFLGSYCPVEAKPIAQEHCAGPRLHLQDGRQVREVLRGLPRERRLREAAPDCYRSGEAGRQQGLDKLKGSSAGRC